MYNITQGGVQFDPKDTTALKTSMQVCKYIVLYIYIYIGLYIVLPKGLCFNFFTHHTNYPTHIHPPPHTLTTLNLLNTVHIPNTQHITNLYTYTPTRYSQQSDSITAFKTSTYSTLDGIHLLPHTRGVRLMGMWLRGRVPLWPRARRPI